VNQYCGVSGMNKEALKTKYSEKSPYFPPKERGKKGDKINFK
jgi:hypothetical protein